MKISVASKVSLSIAILIMLGFFAMQTSLVMGYSDITYNKVLWGWISVILFMPFFFFTLVEFVRRIRYKLQTIDDTLSAIDKSNILIEFDTDGTIVSCNEIFCEALGYSAEEIVGQNHSMIVPNDIDQREYQEFWRLLRSGKTNSGEFRRKTKAGETIWIYGNYNPIQNPYGETYRILKIASDITDKKNAELEVGKKNAYLEHAAKILRHDMHSGINTYIPRGLSSLKRRVSKEKIKELKIESPLKMIEEGLTHTQRVYKGVKEFTNLVKADSQLEKVSCNLKEILNTYLQSTAYVSQVSIGDLITCEVNESLFCTAVDNLIRNGLKYNDSSTKMVSIYMTDDHTLVIEDNGRGMSQEEFNFLSQPYTRKDGQQENGSGLGLNICVAIINEHGFSITAEKIKQGTKIIIKIK